MLPHGSSLSRSLDVSSGCGNFCDTFYYMLAARSSLDEREHQFPEGGMAEVGLRTTQRDRLRWPLIRFVMLRNQYRGPIWKPAPSMTSLPTSGSAVSPARRRQ